MLSVVIVLVVVGAGSKGRLFADHRPLGKLETKSLYYNWYRVIKLMNRKRAGTTSEDAEADAGGRTVRSG